MNQWQNELISKHITLNFNDILSVFICTISRVIYMFKEMYHNYLKISCKKIFYAYSALWIPPWCPAAFSGRILSFFFLWRTVFLSEEQKRQHHHKKIIFDNPSVQRDNWKCSKTVLATLFMIPETWKFRRPDSTTVLGVLFLECCANAMLGSTALSYANIFSLSGCLPISIYHFRVSVIIPGL